MREFMQHNYGEIYAENQLPESGLLSGMALMSLMVCIINCAFPEVEILLTGGRVPIPQGFVKLACFGFLTILMLMYGKLNLSVFPTTMWIVVVGYLILVFPFLWFVQNKPPGDIFFDYNAYYCPLIFAPVATALIGRMPERVATRIFLGTFAVLALLGWAQYILQDPLLPLASSDGNFRIFASQWMMAGETRIRSTSLFGSSLWYGNFAVVVAAIAIGMCGKPGGWRKGIPLYLFAAATCYTTWTRVVFLQLFLATVAAVTFTFGRKPNRVSWQPWIALGLGGVLAFGGVAELVSKEDGLASISSLELRLQQWDVYGATFMHATLGQQLFGFGFCQADKPAMIPAKEELLGKGMVILDNTYFALTLHIGLVGMILVISLLWAMWRRLRSETVERPTPVLIGISSFWATFLVTGIFNVEPASFGFWFLIATIVLLPASTVERETDWSGEIEPIPELA
jgi:hypothetical protein